MTYNWEKIVEHGEYEHGFVDVFKTNIENNNLYVIINYLVQFDEQDERVVTTLLLEGEKNFWTKGKINNVIYDCEERINNVYNFKFRTFNKLEYMTIQTFHFKELGNLIFGNNGDFNFEKPIT